MTKSPKVLLLALVGIALVVGAIVAVVIVTRDEAQPSQAPSQDKVKIELRASPIAEIRIDGKNVGKTPITLQFDKSDKDIKIEATLVRTLVKRGGQKQELYKGYRTVKLDRDRLLDFTYSNTTLVESEESNPLDR
jgi:hypothetical protein